MTKRLAIQLFGHVRTFERTFENFKKHMLEPNQADGYEVDIFVHSWSEIEPADKTWHEENSSVAGKKLTPAQHTLFEKIYKPKVWLIETQTEGKRAHYSRDCVNNARKKYEKGHDIQYDWVIMTRPDILFHTDFRIDEYIRTYQDEELKYNPIPKDFVLVGHSGFTRRNVIDSRYVCESDLVWFGRPEAMPHPKFDKPKSIILNYQLYRDFDLCRFDMNIPQKRRKKWKYFLYSLIPYALVHKKMKKHEAKK